MTSRSDNMRSKRNFFLLECPIFMSYMASGSAVVSDTKGNENRGSKSYSLCASLVAPGTFFGIKCSQDYSPAMSDSLMRTDLTPRAGHIVALIPLVASDVRTIMRTEMT